MKNKISILLSSSKKFRNTGMFSVDLAAYDFFSRNFPEAEIKFYVFELGERKYYSQYESLLPYITYNEISKDNISDIAKSDLIVFWSDFFHNRSFLEEYMEDYHFSKCKSSAEREDKQTLFHRAFFLEGEAPSVIRKSVIFGNSLMPSARKDFEVKDRYTKNFLTLYENAFAVMPRDEVSNVNARAFSGAHSIRGIDPAFLYQGAPRYKKKRILGLFLGRRTEISVSNVFSIMRFAKKEELKIEWLPWMINTESMIVRAVFNPRQMKNLFLHCLLSFVFKSDKEYSKSNLLNLSRHSVIITDTYHLCINAMSQGVHVYGVGSNSTIYGKKAKDLHDKKKEVLFRMLGRSNRYFDVSDISCDKMQENYKERTVKDEMIDKSNASKVDSSADILKNVCENILKRSNKRGQS